jgi:hypothetical protein
MRAVSRASPNHFSGTPRTYGGRSLDQMSGSSVTLHSASALILGGAAVATQFVGRWPVLAPSNRDEWLLGHSQTAWRKPREPYALPATHHPCSALAPLVHESQRRSFLVFGFRPNHLIGNCAATVTSTMLCVTFRAAQVAHPSHGPLVLTASLKPVITRGWYAWSRDHDPKSWSSWSGLLFP